MQTLQNIDNVVKENFLENFLKKIVENLENLEISDKNKIEQVLSAFILKNQKEYINKIKTEDWIIYEYEEFYMWYINNKKIDFKGCFKNIFGESKIMSIEIDNEKRKNDIDKLKEDLTHSEKIRIKIKKNQYLKKNLEYKQIKFKEVNKPDYI